MKTEDMLDPQRWAERTFVAVQLKDMRRRKRAVRAAAQMARDASASLPQQMQSWKDVKALYRLLDEADGTFEALMHPHWQQTRATMEAETVVLLVQDTTEIDLSHRAHLSGRGQIGNAKGRGFLLQTVLAIVPETRSVLGCLAQKTFVRIPAPPKEQRYQRRHRENRESDVWMEMVKEIGSPTTIPRLVHVGDRGADMFPFFRACLSTQTHFLVRAAQNRRREKPEEEIGKLLDQVRVWPSEDQRSFEVPAPHGRLGRETRLQMSYGPVTLLPPWNDPRGNKEPLKVWVVRVWEEEPPEGEDPLEWILLTSMEVSSSGQAWECAHWYRCRWVVEDSHQCLKTGCRIEERQMQTGDRLLRLLGLFSPGAVRLLQLRDLSRQTPQVPAFEVLEVEAVAIIAARTGQSPSVLTLGAFWNEVACMGGFLARTGDGQPGWKTLWKGWLQLQTLLDGVHLAFHLRLEIVGKNQA